MNLANVAGITDRDILKRDLASFTLLDVGVILSYNRQTGMGEVQVKTNNFPAEILFSTSFTTLLSNTPCLVFCPASAIASMRDPDTFNEALFANLKAIPLFTNTQQTVEFNRNIDGSVGVYTEDYNAVFSEKQISVSTGDSKIACTLDKDGINIASGPNVSNEILPNGDKVRTIYGSNGKAKIVITDRADGSYTRVVNDDNEQALITESGGADGSFSRTVKDTSTLIGATDGSYSLNWGQETVVNIDAEKKITVKGATLTINPSGAVSIETSNTVDIKGAGVTIDASSGLMSLKNTQSSVYAVLTSY